MNAATREQAGSCGSPLMDGLSQILAQQRKALLTSDLTLLQDSSARLVQTLGALAGVLGTPSAEDAARLQSALQVNRELLVRRHAATQRGLSVLFPPAPTYSPAGTASSPLPQGAGRRFSKA